jgi:hypothetical protein
LFAAPTLYNRRCRREDGQEVQANTLVEQDIAHLSRVMRAFVFRRGGAITGYWQNRLDVLCESRHLNDYQRHWVQDLMHELQEIEQRTSLDG